MENVGSPSIAQPDYWWYRARAELLQAAVGRLVDAAASVLDVGSADGPSVGWPAATRSRVALDIDPRGLVPGDVCASAVQLPFADANFELPAYQWAWSDFDVQSHHHRRYTRRRLVAAVEACGLEVVRATYLFAGTLPFFLADRLRSRMRDSASSTASAHAVPTADDVAARTHSTTSAVRLPRPA